MPQAASACTDSRAIRYYFLTQPPVVTPTIMFVQVTIVSRSAMSVEARLEKPYASLSVDGMIHIELTEPPEGTNCVEWGDLEGPVYVVASAALIDGGRASIRAVPVKPRYSPERSMMQQLRRNATIWIDPSIEAPRVAPPPQRRKPDHRDRPGAEIVDPRNKP